VFYEFDLTIPANTPEASPAELTVVMASGIIEQIEVQIPRGQRSLVHTIAIRGAHQLWPSNPDGTIKGDDARIVWGEDYDISEPPHTLTLQGWSPDTVHSHVVTWRFNVTPAPVKEAAKPVKKRGILSALINKGAS